MERGWISLDEALARKRKPYPKPFCRLSECSGIANIGAELKFGTVPCGEHSYPAIVIVHHVCKDVVGPILSYWFALWHKSCGYTEFDIRWLWAFLGETEPAGWKYPQKCQLKILSEVRETLLRVPEDRRNEFIDSVTSGRFLRAQEDF